MRRKSSMKRCLSAASQSCTSSFVLLVLVLLSFNALSTPFCLGFSSPSKRRTRSNIISSSPLYSGKTNSDKGNKINGDDENNQKDLFVDETFQTTLYNNDGSSSSSTSTKTKRSSTQSFEFYAPRPKCNKWTSQQQDFPPEVYNIDPLPPDAQTMWADGGTSGQDDAKATKQVGNGDDYFRATLLVRGRSYARPNAFELDQLYELPDLQDLASPPNPEYVGDNLWSNNGALLFRTTPFRLGLLIFFFFSFGPMVNFLYTHLPAVEKLESLSESNFVPGISIVYGTYLSLTLNILYQRQQKITDFCAKETSQLLQLTRRIFHLLDETNTMKGKADIPASEKSKFKISVAEYIADQVRVLVKASRGRELMKIVYSDPYEGIDEVLNEYRDELVAMKNTKEAGGIMVDVSNSLNLIGTCSDVVSNMVVVRSERLSNESTFLPPAHFIVARVLAALIIIGYTVATVTFVDADGYPPVASSAFFAVLSTVYLFFSTIISDLNNPFNGVYQIRRSGIAANLLAIKWIIQKDPTLACEVNFEGEVGHEILWQDPLKMEQMAQQKQQS
ncbi:unnamed protein product [Cylindrotheca closterium]|uniref:Uncharacterized protein n=1 Tax=Cylindrotheca closterium TaxID=2856 RepID=A0AAD2JG59_9STRA|nr:unnamed protein product [Cylindrotheca closterium]